MQPLTAGSEAYLEAFMSGFEFVLLAIRGRLAEEGLDPAERDRLEGFLQDYWRIAEAYHQRHAGPAPETLMAYKAELVPAATN